MALFWRIWAVVSAINLLVLAVFVGLATLQFDAIHSRMIGERLVVFAGRAAEPFEAAARIGLPVATVRNAPGLLERIRQIDHAIASIHVFDQDGNILHSTDRQASERIPKAALAAREAAGGLPWSAEAADGFLGGVDIHARDGDSVGGVVIVYPATQNETRVKAMASELMIASIVILLAGAGLSAVLLRIGLRHQVRDFATVDAAISGFERDSWRSAAAAESIASAGGGANEIRLLLDAAEERYHATGRALAAGGRQE